MTRHGQVLAGRYELDPLLGVGGMASVYRATDRALERSGGVRVPVLVCEAYRCDRLGVSSLYEHPELHECIRHPRVVDLVEGELVHAGLGIGLTG